MANTLIPQGNGRVALHTNRSGSGVLLAIRALRQPVPRPRPKKVLCAGAFRPTGGLGTGIAWLPPSGAEMGMTGDPGLSEEQQRYLEGFLRGVAAKLGTGVPAAAD